MSTATARNRNLAPRGYIQIRIAIEVVRKRMFSYEIPEAVLIAAQKNVNSLDTLQANFSPEVQAHPIKEWVDPSCAAVTEAIRIGEIALFAMTEKGSAVFAIPQIIAVDVLARVGIGVSQTQATIYLRFINMAPMNLLQGLEVSDLQRSGSATFSLILNEAEFEGWLGRAARQNRWPLDQKARKPVGRPERLSVVKPFIKMSTRS
jgi:hypothetical protein